MPKPLPLQSHHGTDAAADPIRAAVRFPLHLPVVLRTDLGDVDAITVDISSTGVLFSMATTLLAGAPLKWIMHLPAALLGTPQDVAVECTGRVIWSADSQTGKHTGAVIDEYVLRDEVS